jgi:hypothetical protein
MAARGRGRARAHPGGGRSDVVCATFLPAPSPLAMWARRQAHETAIHRVDAERAAGVASSCPPAFAADGVDELLVGFIPRPRINLRADPPRSLRIRATDAAGDWLVRIGPQGPVTGAGEDGADCEVRGPASDLYLALWSRQDTAGLAVRGDGEVLALFSSGSTSDQQRSSRAGPATTSAGAWTTRTPTPTTSPTSAPPRSAGRSTTPQQRRTPPWPAPGPGGHWSSSRTRRLGARVR